MNTKAQLPRSISDQVDQKLKAAGEATRAGDLEESIRLSQEAWDLMPAPQSQWDFYPETLATNMVKKQAAVGHEDGARLWLGRLYELYGDKERNNHFVLMTEGEALSKLGRQDEAHAVFGRIYELFGRKGFAGEQLQYLELYLKRNAGSGE